MDQIVKSPNNPLAYKINTFGCKVNTYDTGLIQKNLNSSGSLILKDDPRVHVLNTCAVTAEATKEALKLIRRLKAKDPFCTVIVTGCGAQVDTDHFANLKAADLIVANSHKSQLPFIIDQYFKGELKERVFKSNIFKKEDVEAGGGVEETHTRSFLKIQDGCNSFCTYCIIPFARGQSRSISIFDLVQRVNELHAKGVNEVVLTGVHIGDYEDRQGSHQNSPKVLEDLLESLLAKTKMPRFRLSSLEPIELTDRLLEIYQDSRMCPHFHMSIQSANTDVLALMKRKYTKQDVQKSLLNIEKKVKNAFVGMDVIVGFCNETHEHFEDTYLTLADLPWTKIHVFPYSERAGTRAVSYSETVHVHERSLRADRLRELSHQRYEERAKAQIGDVKEALILKNRKAMLHNTSTESEVLALSHDYWNLVLPAAENHEDLLRLQPGQLRKIQITNYRLSDRLKGEGVLEGRWL